MTTLNDQGVAFELPPTLKARCMRTYGWSDEFAEKALTGYRQFIKVKVQLEDWHATTLSPSLTVDFVWHQHILDVEHYVKACNDYCGRLIGHNPDGGLGGAAREERIKATKVALKVLFGRAVDAQVWTFGQDSSDNNEDNNNNEDDVAPLRDSKRRRHLSAEEIAAVAITLRVQDEHGEEMSFKIKKKTTPMRRVFDAYCKAKGVAVGSFYFLLGNDRGKRIKSFDTAEMHKLNDQDVILVLSQRQHPNYTITIRVYDGREELSFKIKTRSPMRRIFSAYAQRKGVEPVSLRYLLDGERIEPKQTPIMLELEDQDRIEAMPEQGGC